MNCYILCGIFFVESLSVMMQVYYYKLGKRKGIKQRIFKRTPIHDNFRTQDSQLDPECTYELPCAYLLLGAGTAQEDVRYGKPMHNESVVFNENILPRGSALLAYGAMQWLEDQE